MKTVNLLSITNYAILYNGLVSLYGMKPFEAAKLTYLLNTANIDTCRGLCDTSVPESSADRFTNEVMRRSYAVQPIDHYGLYALLDLIAENIDTDFLIDAQLGAYGVLLGIQDRLDAMMDDDTDGRCVLLILHADEDCPFDCECKTGGACEAVNA